MISYPKKFIFIHIPRTGGTSIEEALSPYDSGDAKVQVGKGGIWNPDNSTKEKLVKVLGNEKANNAKHLTALDWKKVLGEEYDNFYKFTIVRNPIEKAASIMKFNGQNPNQNPDWLLYQSLYFEDTEGNNIIDDIFKFEELETEWNKICSKLGIEYTSLPHRNNSGKAKAINYLPHSIYSELQIKLKNETIKLGYE